MTVESLAKDLACADWTLSAYLGKFAQYWAEYGDMYLKIAEEKLKN